MSRTSFLLIAGLSEKWWNSITSKENFICRKCSQTFSERIKLQTHKLVHLKAKQVVYNREIGNCNDQLGSQSSQTPKPVRKPVLRNGIQGEVSPSFTASSIHKSTLPSSERNQTVAIKKSTMSVLQREKTHPINSPGQNWSPKILQREQKIVAKKSKTSKYTCKTKNRREESQSEFSQAGLESKEKRKLPIPVPDEEYKIQPVLSNRPRRCSRSQPEMLQGIIQNSVTKSSDLILYVLEPPSPSASSRSKPLSDNACKPVSEIEVINRDHLTDMDDSFELVLIEHEEVEFVDVDILSECNQEALVNLQMVKQPNEVPNPNPVEDSLEGVDRVIPTRSLKIATVCGNDLDLGATETIGLEIDTPYHPDKNIKKPADVRKRSDANMLLRSVLDKTLLIRLRKCDDHPLMPKNRQAREKTLKLEESIAPSGSQLNPKLPIECTTLFDELVKTLSQQNSNNSSKRKRSGSPAEEWSVVSGTIQDNQEPLKLKIKRRRTSLLGDQNTVELYDASSKEQSLGCRNILESQDQSSTIFENIPMEEISPPASPDNFSQGFSEFSPQFSPDSYSQDFSPQVSPDSYRQEFLSEISQTLSIIAQKNDTITDLLEKNLSHQSCISENDTSLVNHEETSSSPKSMNDSGISETVRSNEASPETIQINSCWKTSLENITNTSDSLQTRSVSMPSEPRHDNDLTQTSYMDNSWQNVHGFSTNYRHDLESLGTLTCNFENPLTEIDPFEETLEELCKSLSSDPNKGHTDKYFEPCIPVEKQSELELEKLPSQCEQIFTQTETSNTESEPLIKTYITLLDKTEKYNLAQSVIQQTNVLFEQPSTESQMNDTEYLPVPEINISEDTELIEQKVEDIISELEQIEKDAKLDDVEGKENMEDRLSSVLSVDPIVQEIIEEDMPLELRITFKVSQDNQLWQRTFDRLKSISEKKCQVEDENATGSENKLVEMKSLNESVDLFPEENLEKQTTKGTEEVETPTAESISNPPQQENLEEIKTLQPLQPQSQDAQQSIPEVNQLYGQPNNRIDSARQSEYECNECQQKFENARHLRHHQKTHSSSYKRTYQMDSEFIDIDCAVLHEIERMDLIKTKTSRRESTYSKLNVGSLCKKPSLQLTITHVENKDEQNDMYTRYQNKNDQQFEDSLSNSRGLKTKYKKAEQPAFDEVSNIEIKIPKTKPVKSCKTGNSTSSASVKSFYTNGKRFFEGFCKICGLVCDFDSSMTHYLNKDSSHPYSCLTCEGKFVESDWTHHNLGCYEEEEFVAGYRMLKNPEGALVQNEAILGLKKKRDFICCQCFLVLSGP